MHRDTVLAWRSDPKRYGNDTYAPVPEPSDVSMRTPVERLYNHLAVYNSEKAASAKNPAVFTGVLNNACGWGGASAARPGNEIRVILTGEDRLDAR